MRYAPITLNNLLEEIQDGVNADLLNKLSEECSRTPAALCEIIGKLKREHSLCLFLDDTPMAPDTELQYSNLFRKYYVSGMSGNTYLEQHCEIRLGAIS